MAAALPCGIPGCGGPYPCVNFVQSPVALNTCTCGHPQHSHAPPGPIAPPLGPSPFTICQWTSFLLSLGFDVAVRMVVPGGAGALPLNPNLLQLHRATLDPNWPINDLQGIPMPPPVMYGNPAFGSRLFIRETTELLIQEIPLAFNDAAALRLTRFQVILILGIEGVGKSTTIPHYINHLLQPRVGAARPSIIYIHHNFGSLVFVQMRGSGPVAVGAQPPRLTLNDITFAANLNTFDHALSDPTTMMFIDLGPDIEQLRHIPLVWKARVMIVLSPESTHAAESVVKEIKKTERFVPEWSQADIQLMRRFVHPDANERAADTAAAAAPGGGGVLPVILAGETMLPGFPAARVDSLFDEFGGVPRSIFDRTSEELRVNLNSALGTCSLSAIVEKGANGRLDKLGRFSSMLLHYSISVPAQPVINGARAALLAAKLAESPDPKAQPAAPLPFQLQHPRIHVASTFIKQVIFDRYRHNKLDQVVKFLDDCIDHSNLSTVRGDMFEPFAHEVMGTQGTQAYYVQQLDDPNNPNAGAVHGRIGHITLRHFTVAGAMLPVRVLGNFANLAANQYGKPTKRTWETLDAVIAPNISLQFTVSNSHSVVTGGLYDAERQLRALVPAVAQPAFRLQHFFCVPRDRFDTYTLTGGNFRPTPDKPLPNNVDYFVLLMEQPTVSAERGPPGIGPGHCGCTTGSMCKMKCPCSNTNPPVKCIPGVCGCKGRKCTNK